MKVGGWMMEVGKLEIWTEAWGARATLLDSAGFLS